MEIFALKVDDAGYMVFPGPTIVNSWINLTIVIVDTLKKTTNNTPGGGVIILFAFH